MKFVLVLISLQDMVNALTSQLLALQHYQHYVAANISSAGAVQMTF